MTRLPDLDTPAALVDAARMQRNIARMQARMDALGVRFRPHVKTSKCLPVVRAQLAAGARGITVSTLKEAAQFLEAGIADTLYAVGMAPGRLPRALALRRAGCDLKLVVDNVEASTARRSRPRSRSTPTATARASRRTTTTRCRRSARRSTAAARGSAAS